MSRSQVWYVVQATETPKAGALESEQTIWHCLADRPMAAETARKMAQRAVEEEGYARSRVFRGKRVGRLIHSYES